MREGYPLWSEGNWVWKIWSRIGLLGLRDELVEQPDRLSQVPVLSWYRQAWTVLYESRHHLPMTCSHRHRHRHQLSVIDVLEGGQM